MTQNRLSTASDVYSYAIIMYEMLTWQMPFHDLSKEQVGQCIRAAAAAAVLLGGVKDVQICPQAPKICSCLEECG
jgi:serine/threonine protein kinase